MLALLVRVAVLVCLLAPALPPLRAEETPGYRTYPNILYRPDDAQLDDYAREQCRLDIYAPTGKKDFATIVWFHGGGLTGGKRNMPRRLMEQNVAVVDVEYRLSPHVKTQVCVADAAAAVAWVFKHIEEVGGSSKKIVVSGHSAGGYLTSMIGLDKHWLAAEGVDANELAGLAPFSGQAVTHYTNRAEREIPKTQPIVDDMAPLYHVRKDAPPMLIISGDREMEMLGRYEEQAYFWRMLKVVGHPDVTLLEMDGYDHGGMADPGFPLLLKFVRRVTP
jgi:acetyl esterase/lipase